MNILKKLYDLNMQDWEKLLSFDQRMALFNFRMQRQISLIIIIFCVASLSFDIGAARRLAAWFTSIISFIVGFWMPSPGFQLKQNTKQNITEINNPAVLIEGDGK